VPCLLGLLFEALDPGVDLPKALGVASLGSGALLFARDLELIVLGQPRIAHRFQLVLAHALTQSALLKD
jgi:hypothetical protein